MESGFRDLRLEILLAIPLFDVIFEIKFSFFRSIAAFLPRVED